MDDVTAAVVLLRVWAIGCATAVAVRLGNRDRWVAGDVKWLGEHFGEADDNRQIAENVYDEMTDSLAIVGVVAAVCAAVIAGAAWL